MKKDFISLLIISLLVMSGCDKTFISNSPGTMPENYATIMDTCSKDSGKPIEITTRVGHSITECNVGTNNPQAKLAVNGEILAKSVRVNTSSTYWPDYVFGDGYNLMSLRELERYVTENKHLPGVPSAQEVEEQGDVDLGAMNALLLEKVEELTRYVIDLQNQIDELKKGKE